MVNHLPRVHKYCVKLENVMQVTCVLYYSYLILVKSLTSYFASGHAKWWSCLSRISIFVIFSFRFHCFNFLILFFRSLFWLQTCPTNYYVWDFLSWQFNRTQPVYKICWSNENNRYDENLLKYSWLHSLWGCHQRRKSAQVILKYNLSYYDEKRTA